MQIVYISNRPKIMLETLEHIAVFMPFINEAIICSPDDLVEEFVDANSPVPLQTIRESEILDTQEQDNLDMLDHQRRNYLLRVRMAAHKSIDKMFIMSDDDARPLKKIKQEIFTRGDKHYRYTFYDLADWDNNQTEFDSGQISTFAILLQEDLEHMSYASHIPQIISRDLFLEAAGYFKQYVQSYSMCEWSCYFNAANHSPNQ